MYAVETYFIAPTNTRGARIKARVMEGSRNGRPARNVSLPWNHRLGASGNHLWAAETLVARLGWDGEWIEASGHNGSSVWVQVGLSDGRRLSAAFFVPARTCAHAREEDAQ